MYARVQSAHARRMHDPWRVSGRRATTAAAQAYFLAFPDLPAAVVP